MARDGDPIDLTKREVREMNFASAQTSQQQVNQLRGSPAGDTSTRSPEIVVVPIPDVSTLRTCDTQPPSSIHSSSARTSVDAWEPRADLSSEGTPSQTSGPKPGILAGAPTAAMSPPPTERDSKNMATSPTPSQPAAEPQGTQVPGPETWWYSLADLAQDRPILELSRRILAQFPSIAPATLLISSADAELSTNRCTARVAACISRLTGCRVLLVDANLEGNVGAVKQSGSEVAGLAEIIAENRPWKDLVIPTQEAQLSVLPCGTAEVPMRRVAGETLVSLNAQWQQDYTYVFINAGHVKQLVTRRFAVCCDGTYVLVGLNQTTKKDAHSAMKLLAENHARVLGAIVFDAPPRS